MNISEVATWVHSSLMHAWSIYHGPHTPLVIRRCPLLAGPTPSQVLPFCQVVLLVLCTPPGRCLNVLQMASQEMSISGGECSIFKQKEQKHGMKSTLLHFWHNQKHLSHADTWKGTFCFPLVPWGHCPAGQELLLP